MFKKFKYLINLTPHKVTFLDESNNVIREIEPSGILARVTANTVALGMLEDIPVTSTEFGDVYGLPEEDDIHVYIVSSLVAQAMKDRNDIFIPNESVRDDKGLIIGCRSLGVIK